MTSLRGRPRRPGSGGLRRRLRGRRPTLLQTFAVSSLLLVALLGFALTQVIRSMVIDRARDQAESAVVVAVRLGLQPQLTPADLRAGFDPAKLAHVESVLKQASSGNHQHSLDDFERLDPVRIKIFNAEGTIVYSDERQLIGERFDHDKLNRALSGEVVSELTSLGDSDNQGERRTSRLLEVYVPVQYSASPGPDGVMEVYFPYDPVAAAIRHDTALLTSALAGGLGVFWLILFRLVASASRRLRRQTDELLAHAARQEHQATHDPLTGLPNRAVLLDRLSEAVSAGAHSGRCTAALVIDLDRFKDVNDALGHRYGDELLIAVGHRLADVVPAESTIARLGADEYAVVLSDVGDESDAYLVGQRMLERLHEAFLIGEMTLDMEVSIGVAVAPQHGTTAETLLRNADIAMYAAKAAQAGVALCDPAQHALTPQRLTVLGDLRRALEAGDELFLHYQPKVGLSREELHGVEALLRWQHPTRGPVSPAEFIPVAEGTALIRRLTEHVLDLALTQARRWLDAGHRVPVSVNVSARCLADVALPQRVQAQLDHHCVPAELLRLELTESAIMGDPGRALDVLRRLHRRGIRLSIDDFGTGYSSMAYLKRLPVDELKIDRSFVAEMTVHDSDAVLVRAAVDLGRNLGLTVVAEGVETAEQVRALCALGCDIAQGYHFARPGPAEQVLPWLATMGSGAASGVGVAGSPGGHLEPV